MTRERAAEVGQAQQVLPVGDFATSALRRLPDARKRGSIYGRLLTHAINLVGEQPNRDSSWVANELMNFGLEALSPTELQKGTHTLLRAEYQKIAITEANRVLVQVESGDLGVQPQPLPEEKFMQLFHWAGGNKLVTAETVTSLLPFWANIISSCVSADIRHLPTPYSDDLNGWRKINPSVPARLLAGAVAAESLAAILEKEEAFAGASEQFRTQAQAQIVLAGAGAAAIPNTFSPEKLRPVIADFFKGQERQEKEEGIRNILAGEKKNFYPAVIAFNAFVMKEIVDRNIDQIEKGREITLEVTRDQWPQFKSQLVILYPFLTQNDFKIMQATVARGLFIDGFTP